MKAGLVLAGALIGVIAALCGIGGGLFAVPILHFLCGRELRTSVATALYLVLATALAATATELLREAPALRWGVVLPLGAGAFIGAQLGYAASKRIDATLLRKVFVVLLLVAGARILFFGGASGEAASPSGGADLVMALAAAGIGVAGGFVAPIVGIGGGLVFVPSLFFFLPELGFDGARACSLAAAVVTGSRSIWLYEREGRTERGLGLALGAGALLGAVTGVVLIQQPGWVEVGRRGLGVVLWIVALRFARSVYVERAAQA